MTDPTEDKEQELVEHLRELRNRLVVAIASTAIASLGIALLSGREIIPILIKFSLPPDVKVMALSPVEYVYTFFIISIVVGIYLSTPVIIYEIFKFAEPGLYPEERRLFLRIVPTSFILFTLGILFSFFVLIPPSSRFLIFYAGETAEPMLVLSRFVSFIGFMVLSIGLIFQIPLIIAFLVKARLVSVSWLKYRRRYIYAILLALGFFLSPDPTPITPVVVALTLVFIFELSLLFAERLL